MSEETHSLFRYINVKRVLSPIYLLFPLWPLLLKEVYHLNQMILHIFLENNTRDFHFPRQLTRSSLVFNVFKILTEQTRKGEHFCKGRLRHCSLKTSV
jgi:hypothetical protein